MGSGANAGGGGWFLDYGGLEDEVQAVDFLWARHIMDDPTQSSALGLDFSHKEDGNPDGASRKRFLELSSILDPNRPPKADKVLILSDAARHLNQLRLEAEKLKESNEALQDKIKNLKAEKSELRDEKVRLKAEKERMEQMIKTMSVPSFVAHPTAAPFHPANYAACNKNGPYPSYPPVAMWQWIPPAALDTSQDHALRPPVA
ncbi:hypothetical protein Taro_023484 [Colocasia esculenta]|uniref:Uncharacterized protein n=1 Tax=Colocasia esculenta TaxID=4460 RepID=A0A843V3X2_COLES|nr:hypothetical protein [Colocasia esculenta]